MRLGLGIVWLTLALTAAACGSDDAGSDTAFNTGSGGRGSGAGGGSFGEGPAAGGGDGSDLPPEEEITLDFERPQAGTSHVYVANPETDNIAVINAESLGIHTVEAGDEPAYLQTVAGQDLAIALNVGSSDATIVRTTSGTSRVSQVDVQPGSNAIAVSPDGRHAIVYFDAQLPIRSGDFGSYQDVTVLFLDESGDRAVPMSVGFQPSAVFFQDDGERAFVVTRDGVSILDLPAIGSGTAGIAPSVALGAAQADQTTDVTVTPDGAYALARDEGASILRLVDLASHEVQTLDLTTAPVTFPQPDGGAPPSDAGAPDAGNVADGGVSNPPDAAPSRPADGGSDATFATDGADAAPPAPAPTPAPSPAPAPTASAPPPSPLAGASVTDLDLSPDGTFALAVVRSASVVLRVPIPGAFTDPSTIEATHIEGELIGSATFTPDGSRALLFTTADPSVERMTILELDGASHDSVQLRKGVKTVTPTPDGKKALVIHHKAEGDRNEVGIDVDVRIDRSHGYSLVDLDTGFVKLETTPAELGPFAIVPDATHLFLLFAGGSPREVQRADLTNFFVDRFEVGSPPVSVGVVPGAGRVFVGQDHVDGRIAFIDWLTGDVRSVSGFELNSRIRE